MKDEESILNIPLINNTATIKTKFFNHVFTNAEKSQAMAVVAAGALITNVPLITLINWYGPRYIFTAVGLFGAFATALIPFAMESGFKW